MIDSYLYGNFIIEILYEDNDIAILNKPAGLLTHKKNKNDENLTLQNSLCNKFKINDDEDLKEGIVHRLDKDTSGIIIITKNKEIKKIFQKLFQKRELKKNYIAFSYGMPSQNSIDINKNIIRQKIQKTKFNVSENEGKNALTKVTNLRNYYGSISKLNCEIITGRTHQIRVHLTSMGLPIIGDKNYTIDKEQKFKMKNIPLNIRNFISFFPRQALHSHEIEFIHPILKKKIKITCDLPPDMKDLDLKLQ